MVASIYSIPIELSAGIAKHYFLSSDRSLENSIGWGPYGVEYCGKGADLTPEEEQRVREYAEKFGSYNIHTNNCEMFAWYVKTGRRYSQQTQENLFTSAGAAAIGLVQPVLTVRSMEGHRLKQSIVKYFEEALQEARKEKLRQKQAERDEFWKRRDADL